jgi:site-specific recombinase XerD
MDFIHKSLVNKSSVNGYSRSMDLLAEYARTHNCAEYSPEMAMAFYDSEKIKGYNGHSTLDRRRATIRRLNEYIYGKPLWQRAPRNVSTYKTKYIPPVCPSQFHEEFERFLTHMQKSLGLKDNTIERYRSQCTRMLCDFDEQGIKSWAEIDARTLTKAFSRAVSKKYFVVHSRRLFGYLKNIGVVDCDYSGVLPMLNKRKTLPSVYSPAEVQQLLDSVERFTPQGKRDYAIIMLAAKLGLRASDIRLLRFDNVNFEQRIVSFVQFKTNVPNQLPLYDDVAEALHDYIDNGRETSDEPYIFLNGHGSPLHRQFVTHSISKHFAKSGIDFGRRKHSAHALRMSFASHLIADKVPYEVVRSALGHVSRESTRYYVEFDVESLRTCALEVAPPGGVFKDYLYGGGQS